MEKLSTANSSTEMSVWLLCRSMQGSPGPQLMNMEPPGATLCSTGTGVKVGGGVLVGTGQLVGSGVLVGAGVQVGTGVHVGSGVLVGTGVAVGCGVSVGGTGVSVGGGVGVSVGSCADTTPAPAGIHSNIPTVTISTANDKAVKRPKLQCVFIQVDIIILFLHIYDTYLLDKRQTNGCGSWRPHGSSTGGSC